MYHPGRTTSAALPTVSPVTLPHAERDLLKAIVSEGWRSGASEEDIERAFGEQAAKLWRRTRSGEVGDIETRTEVFDPFVISGIRRGLRRLAYREREVLKLHYGFVDGFNYNHYEIAEIFRITPKRVWEIQHRALRKLALWDMMGIGDDPELRIRLNQIG